MSWAFHADAIFPRVAPSERIRSMHSPSATHTSPVTWHFATILRAHPETAREYAALKISVAEDSNNDLDRYCEGKDAYVKTLSPRSASIWLGEHAKKDKR